MNIQGGEGEGQKDQNSTTQAEDQSTQTIEVVVTGEGPTADEAIKDALINAVRQVLGEVIDSETLVKNDDLINEKILTSSRGIVAKYSVLNQWMSDGVFHKEIRAAVARRELIGKLHRHGVRVRDFNGTNLYAQVFTQLQREKDSSQMLRRIFERYPASVLDARVTSEPRVVEVTSGEDVTLAYELVFGVDGVRYQAFLEEATPVLELLAARKGTITLYARPFPQAVEQLLDNFLPENVRPSKSFYKRTPPVLQINPRYYRENWWTDDFDPKKQMVVMVNTGRSNDQRVTTWTWYHLPLTDITPRPLQLEVRFLNEGKGAVQEGGFSLGPSLPGFYRVRRQFKNPMTHEADEATQVVLSPFFLSGANYGTEIELDRTINFSLEKLKLIKHIESKVVPVSPIEREPGGNGEEPSPKATPGGSSDDKTKQEERERIITEEKARQEPAGITAKALEGIEREKKAQKGLDLALTLFRESRETQSDGNLREAKRLRDNAISRLREIVRDYPGTEAAGDAGALIQFLE